MEGLFALAGVVLGVVLKYVFDSRQQERTDRGRWTDRASEALADVEILLTRTFPPAAYQRIGPHEAVLLGKDSEEVRRAVAVLTSGHPDAEVRRLAGELEAAIYNLMTALERVLRVVHASASPPRDLMDEAINDWNEANSLARLIIDRLHE